MYLFVKLVEHQYNIIERTNEAIRPIVKGRKNNLYTTKYNHRNCVYNPIIETKYICPLVNPFMTRRQRYTIIYPLAMPFRSFRQIHKQLQCTTKSLYLDHLNYARIQNLSTPRRSMYPFFLSRHEFAIL